MSEFKLCRLWCDHSREYTVEDDSDRDSVGSYAYCSDCGCPFQWARGDGWEPRTEREEECDCDNCKRAFWDQPSPFCSACSQLLEFPERQCSNIHCPECAKVAATCKLCKSCRWPGSYHRDPQHTPLEQCQVDECEQCGMRDCPHGAPEHYWKDGCPSCFPEAVLP